MQTEKMNFHFSWIISSVLFIWVSLNLIWNTPL